MSTHIPKIKIIILAAGEGKRMGTGIPKVMNLLKEKPLIEYVVAAAEAAGCGKPLVVVSPKHTLVQEYLGARAEYVVQKEQLGTGHAVAAAQGAIQEEIDAVVVLYGDMPFVQSESIKKFITAQQTSSAALVLATVRVPNFLGQYAQFFDFGRIIRNEQGEILRSVERRDASPEETAILELNPCFYCFKTDWLWRHLKNLKNSNAQNEYYLTDLLQLALEEKAVVETVSVDSSEAIGINTKEQLAHAALS